MRTRSLHLAALPLLAGITLAAGCGAASSSLPAALHDPSTQGVEALRATMRSALLTHNAKEQCELFAPNLLEAAGGTIGSCTKLLTRDESSPASQPESYDTSPSAYVAGERIETTGNVAVYGSIREPVFKAAYTEGAWKIVDKGE